MRTISVNVKVTITVVMLMTLVILVQLFLGLGSKNTMLQQLEEKDTHSYEVLWNSTKMDRLSRLYERSFFHLSSANEMAGYLLKPDFNDEFFEVNYARPKFNLLSNDLGGHLKRVVFCLPDGGIRFVYNGVPKDSLEKQNQLKKDASGSCDFPGLKQGIKEFLDKGLDAAKVHGFSKINGELVYTTFLIRRYLDMDTFEESMFVFRVDMSILSALKELQGVSGAYASGFSDEKGINVLNDGQFVLRDSIPSNSSDRKSTILVKDFQSLEIGKIVLVKDTSDIQDQMHNQFLIQLGILSVSVMIIAVAISFMVGRLVLRPIASLTQALGLMANGQLDTKVPALDRNDEIGEISRSVEVLRESSQEAERLRIAQKEAERRHEEEQRIKLDSVAQAFESGVGHVTSELVDSSSNVHSEAERLAKDAAIAGRQASEVAQLTDSMMVGVHTVAAATEELHSSIAEISRQTSQALEIARDAASQADSATDRVASLQQAASKIGQVVDLINDIAGQTNLLALNATIEAARAGDAGKGFAVVAGEVKSLANQTARATEEISAQIGAVQLATKEAVSTIQQIAQIIDVLEEVNTAIASAVEEQGAATQEIARNVQSVAIGAQNVASNISGTAQTVEEISGLTTRLTTLSDVVAAATERLREVSANFLLTVRN